MPFQGYIAFIGRNMLTFDIRLPSRHPPLYTHPEILRKDTVHSLPDFHNCLPVYTKEQRTTASKEIHKLINILFFSFSLLDFIIITLRKQYLYPPIINTTMLKPLPIKIRLRLQCKRIRVLYSRMKPPHIRRQLI